MRDLFHCYFHRRKMDASGTCRTQSVDTVRVLPQQALVLQFHCLFTLHTSDQIRQWGVGWANGAN